MKQFAVIGLGKFGFHIAQGFAMQGVSVIAIDKNEEQIKEINEYVEDAIMCDSTDINALREAGIGSVDVAIVSIGENIEASILTVMGLKEIGVPVVIAKAITKVHGQILSKIGASKVIYPEREIAKKIVKNMVENLHYETIDLSVTMKIAKLSVPKIWIGLSINDVTFETKYHVKPIAYKHKGVWFTKFESEDILERDDIIVVIGNSDHVEALNILKH